MQKKTVLILSGGLDSTVLAYFLAIEQQHLVHALTVIYGQRHMVEVEAAKLTIAELQSRGVPIQHSIVNLADLAQILKGSSQTDTAVEVPEGHYTDESMKLTVVPNRNMILLATAGALAISTKSDYIAYGAHAGDHAIYPDCRPEFADAMQTALDRADWFQPKLTAPFVTKTKGSIVRLGAKLGVKFELTYSCYKGVAGTHCGKCGTCVERREAFLEAGVPDPTVYDQTVTMAPEA